ncbi:hypothetical protein CI109_103166 [Kwoniella shandongensis]|uniref:Uncharacterized protein n=1 Tax=Kwoniella shandongensis TaxID=1734106 RepID=A0A5M6CDI5_9TREE|nr:uncharacterized protein CI109_000357 [Kwoniella shandongensis]KAA5531515.1 hypothetical protein CI109_000357 [Kwoniella shandongensis]
MAAAGRGGGQASGGYNNNWANNKQAQLTNAYQELAKELGTEKLKVVGGYTLGKVIGEGTYGSVHIATHRLTGTRCAIKKIPKSFTAHLTREIHHHRRLHHPHIVHLHEILATETHVWLVTELCSGGELFDYLVERGRMLEGEARKLFGELTIAVGWMHRRGVVHRDLKLENVLLDGELRIKLGDLGFAREWQRGRLMDTFCGTTGYASPEMLAGRKYLGVETDIWSLGIILYILLCGGLPFDDDDERVMKDLIAKGEYEEPEWLSEEARSLIRGMLHQDPTQRLGIEAILTHPWFKMTIIDKLHAPHDGHHSLPASPLPKSPTGGEPFFSEPYYKDPSSSSRLLTPHVAGPSPLSKMVPQPESEPSETSVDNVDSEHSKTGSGTTTPPTTVEGSDVSDTVTRNNSAEFSATEKALELSHQNSSQSTIRRLGTESPGSASGSFVKNKVAMRTTLEGQVEEEEDDDGDEGRDTHASLPNIDDHSLHLPVGSHHRTPSRTKRRSVSSTLSLERRHSHHSTSGQWQTYHPEDYLAKLNEEHPPHFSTPSEKYLLNQLNDMGMDIGQLKHSVENDACDASAGMWWILRAKQAERGETDDVIAARQASAAKKREKMAAYAREERRKAREADKAKGGPEGSADTPAGGVSFKEETTSIPVTPSFTVMDLGLPIPGPSRPAAESPEVLSSVGTSPTIERLAFSPPSTIELNPFPGSGTTDVARVPPATPPREGRPETISPLDESPARKTRSPSITMLQRATSAWVGGSKKPETDLDNSTSQKDEKRSGSPTKLHKAPPKAKIMPRSDSENGLLSTLTARASPAASTSGTTLSADHSPKRNNTLPLHQSPSGSGATLQVGAHVIPAEQLFAEPSRSKGSKRDSLWTTFRHLFNEEKRRRKREHSGSPLAAEIKVTPAVVLTRGANSRAPHIHRTTVAPGSRRTSLDGRPPMYSRRSSSINSRRSSFNSLHKQELADVVGNLGRRTSQRSHGSQTPTSDREYVDYPSRPGSSHSMQHGNSRRSSMSVRSPTLGSDISGRFKGSAPASPLHNYRRRPPGGSDSTRVRHIKVIPETAVLRPTSAASSVRSNASSRASSAEGRRDSEYDSARDDSASSLRSQKRRNRNGSQNSLAQQIHRTRSPLAGPSGSHPSRKPPIRDVFQSKGKNKDDEWVSEEEEDQFAGGLGQLGGGGGTTAAKMWLNGSRASTFPSANASAKLATPVARRRGERERGRRGSREDEREEERDPKGKGRELQGLGVGTEGMSSRVRRGLPSGRSAAPNIIEEEEEEEE